MKIMRKYGRGKRRSKRGGERSNACVKRVHIDYTKSGLGDCQGKSGGRVDAIKVGASDFLLCVVRKFCCILEKVPTTQ